MSFLYLWLHNSDFFKFQLKNKFEEAKNILKQLGKELVRQNSDLRDYLANQNEQYDGLPCELLHIRHADECDGYLIHE